MAGFRPKLETSPICGSHGNCHVHDYYDRSIIDFHDHKRHTDNLCILRVMCDSCGHTHAILPDIIIPYASYGLIFVLSVLGEYFAGIATQEQLCEKYDISLKQLHRWLSLWASHKQLWLGILADMETSDAAFHASIFRDQDYSVFSMTMAMTVSTVSP